MREVGREVGKEKRRKENTLIPSARHTPRNTSVIFVFLSPSAVPQWVMKGYCCVTGEGAAR